MQIVQMSFAHFHISVARILSGVCALFFKKVDDLFIFIFYLFLDFTKPKTAKVATPTSNVPRPAKIAAQI